LSAVTVSHIVKDRKRLEKANYIKAYPEALVIRYKEEMFNGSALWWDYSNQLDDADHSTAS